MEKLKKIKLNNQMKWMILVGIILFIFVVLSVVHIIDYTRAASAIAKTDNPQNELPEEVIEQANLVDTSKLSPEELKKLNEEELKKAEEKKKEEQKENNKANSKPTQNKYYIKVNYGVQVVTVYTYDKDGKYTVPVKAFVCSTGTATPTSGVYRMSWRSAWGKLFGNVWGQYCTQIVGDILFHSVPYKQNRKDTLVGAYYDKLGTKASMGCIRLTTIDALWIFNNCASGTQVEFYSSSNPGPLGKPVARKISNAPGKLKNWDPTDPDPSNPWRTYKPSQDGTQKPNSNNNTSGNTNTNTDTNTNTNTNTNTSGGTENNTTGNTETPEKPTEPEKPEKPTTPEEGNTQDNTQTSGGTTEPTNPPVATN